MSSVQKKKEIEHRYLLRELPDFGIKPSDVIQGYLLRSFEKTHRIRIETEPDGILKGYETLKGPKNKASGDEDEKEIPLDEAHKLLSQCEGGFIQKDRYKIPGENGLKWEVDVFKGHLADLFIAEIELPDESTPYTINLWLNGVDITEDHRFANSRLLDIEPNELKQMIESVLKPTP